MNDRNINIRCSEEDIRLLNDLCELTGCYNKSILIRYMLKYFYGNSAAIKSLDVSLNAERRHKWRKDID